METVPWPLHVKSVNSPFKTLLNSNLTLGALQIASAVPGMLGALSTSSVPGSCSSGRATPSEEDARSYSRQRSMSGDIYKRRGSLPACQSKRGSICAYTGGAVCETTPTGEVCESRMAMCKSDERTELNGVGEHQEVRHLILSESEISGYFLQCSIGENMFLLLTHPFYGNKFTAIIACLVCPIFYTFSFDGAAPVT